MSESRSSGSELIRTLTHIVVPTVSAVLAAVELVDGAIPIAELGFLVVLMGGVFFAFRNSIAMLDDRLNSEVPR